MAGKKWGIALALLGVFAAGTAMAQDTKALALDASSPWNINYADDSCRLQRMFGKGDDKVMLALDRLGPTDSFRLLLAGQRFSRRVDLSTAIVRFGPELPEQKQDFYAGDLGTDTPAWLFVSDIRLRPRAKDEAGKTDLAADEAAATQLSVGRPLGQPIILRTGPMTDAFAALTSCTDELLTHWGIDPAKYAQIVQPLKSIGSPLNWLKSEDYPSEMILKQQPGLIHFRLVVGEDGRVKSCHIQQSTNSAGFDEAVCMAVKRRARFEPARDKDGNAIIAYYRNRVHFSMR